MTEQNLTNTLMFSAEFSAPQFICLSLCSRYDTLHACVCCEDPPRRSGIYFDVKNHRRELFSLLSVFPRLGNTVKTWPKEQGVNTHIHTDTE